jgi:hypothetical protein
VKLDPRALFLLANSDVDQLRGHFFLGSQGASKSRAMERRTSIRGRFLSVFLREFYPAVRRPYKRTLDIYQAKAHPARINGSCTSFFGHAVTYALARSSPRPIAAGKV